MGNEIIYQCYKTPNNYYLYDRHTHSSLQITKSDYIELISVQNGELSIEDSCTVDKYKSFGLLNENVVEKIEHPATYLLSHHLNNCLKQLTLQVTQQCNLRCSYCAYSGYYNNRKHSNQRMSFETAKKAIDFFAERISGSNEVVIGFYGGEPILEFDLIKKCVRYANQTINSEHSIKYNLTTNGTILTKNILEFCNENKIAITVSLDGAKAEHDANRRFKNGQGTYDIIINNIKEIRINYPQMFAERLLINAVINPKAELSCVNDFFKFNDFLEYSNVSYSTLATVGLKDNSISQYDESFWTIRDYEYLKMLLSLIGRIDKDKVSVLVKSNVVVIEDFYTRLKQNYILGSKEHHNGPCLPGIKRLFVTVDGKLFPCEKVSEQIQCMCIGTLESGFDIENIKYILNNGKLTENECINCWNLRNCSICLGEIECGSEKGFTGEEKKTCCQVEKLEGMRKLIEISILKEYGYKKGYEKEEKKV